MHQSKAGSEGNKYLKYDVGDGMFLLHTESYAKVKCNMHFDMYPFDTQKCSFIINTHKNQTYQV